MRCTWTDRAARGTWRSAGCAWCQPSGRDRRARQRARKGIRDLPGAEHRVGPVRPAFAARVHRPAARGRGHAGRRRFRRGARGGADLDQPRDRRADRGQDHRIAAARRRQPADQAGARQRGVPEGGVDAAVPGERDGRRSVLPGWPGPSEPDRADDAPHRAAGLPSRRRIPGRAAPLPGHRPGHGRGAARRAAVGAAAEGRRRRPGRPAGRNGQAPGHAVAAQVPAGSGVRPHPGPACGWA